MQIKEICPETGKDTVMIVQFNYPEINIVQHHYCNFNYFPWEDTSNLVAVWKIKWKN